MAYVSGPSSVLSFENLAPRKAVRARPESSDIDLSLFWHYLELNMNFI